MTCPTREAGGALRERPGIVYPLLPCAQRPDTSVAIEAALPEAAAIGRQALPPTVVDILGPPASRNQRHRPGDALPGSPHASAVAIALWECSGRPSARRPMDTGVINTTPVINKV